MRTSIVLLAFAFSAPILATAAEGPYDLFQAIRGGDIAYVKAHLTKADLELRDRRGATPLMHAAAFGNLQTLRLLLDAGADVNARNDSDATALLWSARDVDKARLLIERGADVNIRSKQGRTPLMVASLKKGGSGIVALMLAKGADVSAKGNGRGFTALHLAASVGEVETIRLLLAKGADPNAAAFGGGGAIYAAAASGQRQSVTALISKGADVNAVSTFAAPQRNGTINNQHVTALHNAAAYGPVQMVDDLLTAGANIHARDSRGLTPLFFALATEYPSLAMVRRLIAAGADVNARDATGESPLDWAEKFGYPEIMACLKKAGAMPGLAYVAPKHPRGEPPTPSEALARSVRLLEATGAEYFKKGGCVGCHHQPLIARAQVRAKRVGIPIDEAAAKEQLLQMRAQWIPLQEEFLQSLNPGGGANRLAENLLGLKASSYPADIITDSAVVDIAESQEPDGSWIAGDTQPRPPIAESEIAATTRAIQALRAYPIPGLKQELADRIARAKAWLKQAKPVTTEDFAMRLSGLFWSGAGEADLRDAAKALVALQRADGGWGANPHLKADAYATAGALVALAESKVLRTADASYRRGVEYLLSTQFPDGSWHVRSRAIKFQPYFESGFPFGHDQWISVAATAWAVQAIALGMDGSAGLSAAR